MSTERGRLIVRARQNKPPLIQIQIGDKPAMNVAKGEVSVSIVERLGEFADKEVEFERVGGQPKQVREVGAVFVSRNSHVSVSDRSGSEPRRGVSTPRGKSDPRDRSANSTPRTMDFHNPYNFIPAPPRNTTDPDLGDQFPIEQDAFHADRYSGSIRVKLIARTPLLVPDTNPDKVREDKGTNHKTYPLRVGPDGKPLVPASSVRGMLRSAYEAITNSRFGRFAESHKAKLQHRQSTRPFKKVDYKASAWELLDRSLYPAATINELSPADRVFGWVRQDEGSSPPSTRVAAKGLLRVGPVSCDSSVSDATEKFASPGLPLAILSAPEPQQGRFYVARSPKGEAQKDDLSKQQAGYSSGKGLRGRKVYPHQASLPGGHWTNPTDDRTQNGLGQPAHYQEYRRPRSSDGQEQRDGQNRSILGWVKPGAEFSFKLQVQNVSAVELGALLWLLEMPKEYYFRFGGGKPLGFGSLRLDIVSLDVRTGNELRARYSEWHDTTAPGDPRAFAIKAFRDAIVREYARSASGFDEVPFIKAFLTACRGHQDNRPVHYPRATQDGNPGAPNHSGESFKWFVANERAGAQYALKDLANDTGLPTLPEPGGGNAGWRR